MHCVVNRGQYKRKRLLSSIPLRHRHDRIEQLNLSEFVIAYVTELNSLLSEKLCSHDIMNIET